MPSERLSGMLCAWPFQLLQSLLDLLDAWRFCGGHLPNVLDMRKLAGRLAERLDACQARLMLWSLQKHATPAKRLPDVVDAC